MSGKVVDLDSYRPNPHLSGPMRCMACAHEWMAVVPVGTKVFECPQCHCMRGAWNAHVGLARKDSIFVCTCGCDLYFLTLTNLVCSGCGEYMKGWYRGHDPEPPMPPRPRAA